jgi:hypothetical protein
MARKKKIFGVRYITVLRWMAPFTVTTVTDSLCRTLSLTGLLTQDPLSEIDWQFMVRVWTRTEETDDGPLLGFPGQRSDIPGTLESIARKPPSTQRYFRNRGEYASQSHGNAVIFSEPSRV